MRKNSFTFALDIGSEQMKMAVARPSQTPEELPELLDVKVEKSQGMRRGVVVDIEKVAENISYLSSKVGAPINALPREIVVNIGGSHIFCTNSRGVVAVSRADQLISQEDVDRVIAAAQAFSLPSNRELLEVFPKEFIVDGQGRIKDPLKMQGIRLETEVLAVCCFSPYLNNLKSAFAHANIDIGDIIPSAIASAQAVLNSRQKELGVAVLDIGAWTTDMAVFEEGDLIHLAVFPIGSAHITNDIAIGFQIDIDSAEAIKKDFGTCLYQRKGKPEKIKFVVENFLENGSKNEQEKVLIFSRKALVKIIQARVGEIFNEVGKELKKIGKFKQLPAGVVLTGGAVKLTNLIEIAKKELKLPCHIGLPRGIKGIPEDPAFSVVCGLLLSELTAEKREHFIKEGFFSKIKRFFKIFVP